jgi:glycosyltransferase involved in cell wall biosynthesis
MDVLHVTHQFAPETRGGLESYVRDVAAEQRARGIDVHVLTGSMQPWEHVGIESLEVDGLPVHRLHRDDLYFDHHAKAWHAGVAELFADRLRLWKPGLVHVHQWIRLTSDLVATAHQAGVPTVVTLHDFYTSCPRAFRVRPGDAACRRPVSVASCIDCVPKYGHESHEELAAGIELFAASYRAELALAGKVLVAVGAIADMLSETTGVPRDRYQVLPLGYRPRFPGQPPLHDPDPGEPFRFAYWGGVGQHKGVRVLLQALRILVAASPGPSELHVLGDFETPRFEQELRSLGKGLPVTFHGRFDPPALRTVGPHCGVFPSTCLETFGLVLDECFELGLPCIVSDHGALPQRAGAAALRVRPGDAAALAEAMARLRADAGLRARLRKAIPALPPGLEQHCAGLDRIYAEAAAAAPQPFARPVPIARRLAFLQRQRESAQGRVVPEGGPR